MNLTAMAVGVLADVRIGKNGRHLLVGLLRQSVLGRLVGYQDMSDRRPAVPRSGDAPGGR